MNTRSRTLRHLAAPCVCVLLLAGCLKESLFWSPDGSRAAVLTSDGLYLTDAAGKLSPLLLPRAYRVAWLSDSQRLVVAHSREIKDFASLATALGPDRTRLLTAKAESVWQQLLPLKSGKDLPSIKPDDDVGGIVLYLREKYRDTLKEKVGDGWKDLESLPAEWHTLAVARVVGDRLEFGAILHEGLARVGEIRSAPGGSAVAFVTHIELSTESDDSRQILLSPIDGSSPAKIVARHSSAEPDWSADGRALFYFKSESESRGSNSGDDLRLGTLSSSQALDANGKIAIDAKSVAHAGLIFHDRNRVRSLRDGRVVFNAAAFHLPISAKDRDTREEFFAVDPATDAVTPLFSRDRIAALPHSLASFELSPDEKQILVSDDSGKVWLLTLADQKVELIAEGFGKEDSIAPAWRAPGEFTYRKPGSPRAELIQRHGSTETMLSRTWPDEVMQRLTK